MLQQFYQGHRPLIIILSTLIALCFSISGLLTPSIEGLDSSHNVMDGLFFYDLLSQDLWDMQSLGELLHYPLNYHKQYPALGFVYWPPFWPAVESIFFGLFGSTLLAAQLSITFFTLIFCLSFVSICSRVINVWLSFATLVALFTTREFFFSANTIMRDMPAVATMTATLWTALKWQESTTPKRWLGLLVVVATISIYTKQTTSLMLLAIASALLIQRPSTFKEKPTLVAMLSFSILALPLIVFTLTTANANLGQSFGSNTTAIVQGYKGLDRWSMEGWTYYCKWFFRESPGLTLLALVGLYSIYRRVRGKTASLVEITLITWLVLFYVLFSFFDNKSARFTTLVMPAISILAAISINDIIQSRTTLSKVPRIAIGIFLILMLSIPHAYKTYNAMIPRMKNIDKATTLILNQTKNTKTDDCIAYTGKFKQVFVQSIRRQDLDRRLSIVDGADQDSKNCSVHVFEKADLNTSVQTKLNNQYQLLKTSFFSPGKERKLIVYYKGK